MNIAATPTIATTIDPATGVKLDKAHADLKKAAQGFESYFVNEMLKEMRKTIPKDDLTGDSADQENVFQDMSDQAVADSVAKTGSFGVANMMYEQLSKGLPPNNPDGVPAATVAAAAQNGPAKIPIAYATVAKEATR